MGHMGGLINPRPGRGQYRAGFSNIGGSSKPQKRAPCEKSRSSFDRRPWKQRRRRRQNLLIEKSYVGFKYFIYLHIGILWV